MTRRQLLLAGASSFLVACGDPAGGRPTLVSPPPARIAMSPTVRRQVVSPSELPSSSELTATGQSATEGVVTVSPTPDPAPLPVDPAEGTADRSVVAEATGSFVNVYNSAGEITHTFSNPTPTNGPLVFLTTVNGTGWHEVLLPVRPNGSKGWVRDQDVRLSGHNYRVQVDLTDFRCRVFDEGTTVYDGTAGVAAANSPTPGGLYYITELIAPIIPDSVYGPFAYGLSGFSDTFQTFNGGPGQLGIHGTNSPETLGSPVSAGCVRLHNDDITFLSTFLPLGVPVTVA